MGSLTQKPTIVVVPGSFSPPYLYNTFVSQLIAHKYDVVVADLPSVDSKTAATMTNDAQAIRAVTQQSRRRGQGHHPHNALFGWHSWDRKRPRRYEERAGSVGQERRCSRAAIRHCVLGRPWKVVRIDDGKVPEFQIMSKSRYAVHLLPFST